MSRPSDVDDYIAQAPRPVRERLRQIRAIVRAAAPDAEEKLSYSIPYYSLNGRLVYFAHFKNHINLTVMTSGIDEFKKGLDGYVIGKGSIQFPNDQPLPLPLIKKIVTYRAAEQRARKNT